jgi:hypothetical protein
LPWRAAKLLDDLEAHRALARHNRRIVEAWDDRRAALRGDPRRYVLPAFGPAVVEHDLRAFAARAVDFHMRSIGRHHDHRPNAEPPGRNSDAARVIARREGDNAPRPLLL